MVMASNAIPEVCTSNSASGGAKAACRASEGMPELGDSSEVSEVSVLKAVSRVKAKRSGCRGHCVSGRLRFGSDIVSSGLTERWT